MRRKQSTQKGESINLDRIRSVINQLLVMSVSSWNRNALDGKAGGKALLPRLLM